MSETWTEGDATDVDLEDHHITVFCDSDETHGHTVSYFADVKLRRGRLDP